MKKSILIAALLASAVFNAPGAPLKSCVSVLGPSDYLVDLCGKIEAVDASFYVRNLGVTNLHVLFIDAHGFSDHGNFRLGNDEALHVRRVTHGFSFKDIARCFTQEQLTNIHNVYVSSCDVSGVFKSKHVLNHFPNVTNVVHIPQGYTAFVSSFVESVFYYRGDQSVPFLHRPSWINMQTGELSETQKKGTERRMPFVADLYLPGRRTPFATVTATRDILIPKK